MTKLRPIKRKDLISSFCLKTFTPHTAPVSLAISFLIKLAA